MNNNNNINDNLEDDFKSIAPILSGIKKQNNFVVPENYFDELTNNIQDSINLINETPVLSNTEKKNSFSTPDSYFENLHKVVIQNTVKEVPIVSFQEKAHHLFFSPKKIFAYATSFLDSAFS